MTTLLTAVDLRDDRDIGLARQRARVVADRFGFEPQDQIRIASAVSEVARLAVRPGGAGRVTFLMVGDPGQALTVRVVVPRPAPTPAVEVADAGRATDAGRVADAVALDGVRRLMDGFAVEDVPGAAFAVAMTKALPRRGRPVAAPAADRLVDELARMTPGTPTDELARQNRELLRLLDDLRSRELELAEVNRELAETNRGVLALYAELDERAESLRQASELKSRFLSNVSHEFRTPLTSILSMGRLLLDGSDGPLNTEQERQVGYILRASHDLLGMVNDLLDLARIEAGRDEVRVEVVSLPDAFGALRGMLRPLLPADSAVELMFEVQPGAESVRTDEGKLVQVVRNLVSNAIKFTERGEVRVRARPAGGGAVAIEVADTGVGIDPADFPRIFEEFGQVDNPLQRRSQGTGLGLPLARKLMTVLGGSLTVASQPGVGSTFTALLPADPPWPAPGPDPRGGADA